MKEKNVEPNTPAPVPKPPKKKMKKLLKTPSDIIRWFMIAVYAIAVFLLSTDYITATMFIDDNLEVSSDFSRYYSAFATQEEIDKAADELQAALDGLEKKPVDDQQTAKNGNNEQGEMKLQTATFQWQYQVTENIETGRILSLIEKSRAVNRELYTEESVEKLNTATMKAQRSLCATVTITQAALQFMLSGSGSGESVTSDIMNSIMMYSLAVLPVVGFFIASFDRKRHIKNIYAILCSVFCILIIFRIIYPYLAIGSVLSIFAYMLLFALSIGGFYAKQQEDYIILHPEEEPEFTEKHPQFLKALLNEKMIKLSVEDYEERSVQKKKKKKKK